MNEYSHKLQEKPLAGSGIKYYNGFPIMPGRVPLVGHAIKISRDALWQLRRAEAVCGPMFWVYYGAKLPVLQVMGDEGFSILQNQYTDSSHLRQQMGLISGEAMNTFDGPQHRRARGASAAAFTPKGLNRAKVGEFIAETVTQTVSGWARQKKLPVFRETKNIALEVIFRILGIDTGELESWRRHYEDFLLGLIPISVELPGFPAWRCRRARNWLEAKVGKIIEEVRQRGDRDSLVGAMIHGRDQDGEGLPERQLLHNLLGLGFAGSETTAAVMAWMMLKLAQEPAAWQRLCDEASALDSVPLSFAEIVAKVPYAEALFRETLRLYPPAPFEMRHVHTAFELMGRRIPAGINIGASLLHISRNPQRYPDPDHWRPERWLGVKRVLSPIENCQFGGGPHLCLGYHVALLEGTLFITHVARELSQKGIRPRLAGALPAPRYLPFMQPSFKAMLDLSG